jgi:hypothetical protein
MGTMPTSALDAALTRGLLGASHDAVSFSRGGRTGCDWSSKGAAVLTPLRTPVRQSSAPPPTRLPEARRYRAHGTNLVSGPTGASWENRHVGRRDDFDLPSTCCARASTREHQHVVGLEDLRGDPVVLHRRERAPSSQLVQRGAARARWPNCQCGLCVAARAGNCGAASSDAAHPPVLAVRRVPTTGRRWLQDRSPVTAFRSGIGLWPLAQSDQLRHVEVGECQLELGYVGDLKSGFGGAARPQAPGLFAGSFQRGATVEGDARDGQPGLPVDQ